MTVRFAHIRDTLSRAASQEDGFALPTVIVGIVVSLGLGTAMVVSAMSATSGTARDMDDKSAFAVAEAGVSQAIYRYNRFDTSDPATPCLAEVAGGQVVLDETGANANPVQPTGWCAPVTGSSSGGTFSYSVKPEPTGIEIVSSGRFDALTRRVDVEAEYTTEPGNGGVSPFEDLQILGNEITISNGSSIDADVGSKSTLTVEKGGKLYCDEAQAAVSEFPKDPPCAVTAPSFDLPPVNSSLAKVDNDNALLTGACRTWSATRLTITCPTRFGTAGETHDFYVCKLTNNSTITIAPGATVNFWFAPPSECANDTVPIVLKNGSKILTPGEPPATLAFLVSDSTTPTSIYLSAGGWGHWPDASDNFIIYAPTSDVSMDKGQHMYGAIAANSISTASGGSFTKTSLSGTWELPGSTGGPVPHYIASQFFECLPRNPGSVPDAGC